MSKSCCTVPARAENRDLARSDSDVPAYRPHTDIYETEDGVVLLVDLPGVPEGSVDLAVDGDILSLTATSLRIRPEGLELGHGELGDREYRRSFRLPDTVDGTGIEAKLRDGVLEVRLPTAEAAKPRKIKVTV